MSTPRGFGLNGKSLYTNITKPIEVNFQFTVTATNGLGITSLKSNGYVRNVFMHTSTTPTANDGYTNPNPASGFAFIQFKNNFNYFVGATTQIIAPLASPTKIDNSALTAGLAYVISTVGDASSATWLGVGLPVGVTPALGAAFIATTVGAGANTSTSRVSIQTTPSFLTTQIIGDPNASYSNNIGANGGAWALVQFMQSNQSGSAPRDGTSICMQFVYDGSSVTIDGL